MKEKIGKIWFELKRKRQWQNKYFAIIGFVIFFLLVGGISFAYFATSIESKGSLNIVVGNLYTLVESKDLDQKGFLTVKGNETKTIQITVKNPNVIPISYKLYYLDGNGGVKVTYEKTEQYNEVGTLNPDKDSVIKIIIENKQTDDTKVTIGAQVGLLDRTLTLKQGKEIKEKKVLPIMKNWSKDSEEDFHNSMYKLDITDIKFSDKIEVPEDAVNSWDVSKNGDSSVIAWITNGLNPTQFTLEIAGNGGVAAEDLSYFLDGFSGLKEVNFQYLDTSNVVDMSNMFYKCASLTKLDLSGFDTSDVLNMSNMFYECSSLETIDISSFDTSKVVDMSSMFYHNAGLKSLDFRNFDTSNVVNMHQMFGACESLEHLDVSSLDISKVVDMSNMFVSIKLDTLDLSSFKISDTMNVGYMFGDARIKDLNLSNFIIKSALFDDELAEVQHLNLSNATIVEDEEVIMQFIKPCFSYANIYNVKSVILVKDNATKSMFDEMVQRLSEEIGEDVSTYVEISIA